MWGDVGCGWEAAELVRAAIPYWLLVTLPVLFMVAPEPVAAVHEYTAFRMLQHDLHGVAHGCVGSQVNLEARSVSSWSTSRHAVVARLQDLTVERWHDIRSRAGALILVLPANNTLLTPQQKERIQNVEASMLQYEATIPVYFIECNEDTEQILVDLKHSFITDEKSGTALEAITSTATANGYQIVVSAPNPQKLESKVITLHGKLAGRGAESQTIVISAHYDATAVAPELSMYSDSSASGVAALLELARIFSLVYADAETRPGSSLVFVLPGASHHLNYVGTGRWLERLREAGDLALQDVSFAMCLDSLSTTPEVRMHVSKPPKAGGAVSGLLDRLGAPLHHKKINLADETLAWQHERFSIKRMTAFTLSSLETHKDPRRFSILERPSEAGVRNLAVNVDKIVRALASHLYNLTRSGDQETDRLLYGDALSVDEDSLRHWYYYLSSQPRAPHVITTAHTAGTSGVSAALERALSRYLGEATVLIHAPDTREPEYTIYSVTRATLHVYSVKPAIFDLILTVAIIAYLALVYFIIIYFPYAYEEIAKYTTGKTKIN